MDSLTNEKASGCRPGLLQTTTSHEVSGNVGPVYQRGTLPAHTDTESLENQRYGEAVVGKFGEVVEFVAAPEGVTFQNCPDPTLDLFADLGAMSLVGLWLLLTRYRHELGADQATELRRKYDLDTTGLSYAYHSVTWEQLAADYGKSPKQTKRDAYRLQELGFVTIADQSQLERPGTRRQAGNCFVLNGVRLPSDRARRNKLSPARVEALGDVTAEGATPAQTTTTPQTASISEPRGSSEFRTDVSTTRATNGTDVSTKRTDVTLSSHSSKTVKDSFIQEASAPPLSRSINRATDAQLDVLKAKLGNDWRLLALEIHGVANLSELSVGNASELISFTQQRSTEIGDRMRLLAEEKSRERVERETAEAIVAQAARDAEAYTYNPSEQAERLRRELRNVG